MDLHYVPLFLGLVAFAACSHGFMGLGFGIIALAGMGLTSWNLERTAASLNIVIPLLLLSVIFAGRKDFKIDTKIAFTVILGELGGVPLGYWCLATFGARPIFTLFLGIALVAMVLDQVIRPRFDQPLSLPVGFLAGLIGGVLTGAFTSGGPVVALFLYSRYRHPADAKGTLQLIFMGAILYRLVNIQFLGGGFTLDVLMLSAVILPLVLVFPWLGHRLARNASSRLFARVVFGFIGLIGTVHIVKYFA